MNLFPLTLLHHRHAKVVLTLCLTLAGAGSGISSSEAATPCINGSAGGFTCNKIDLVSHVDLPDISAGPQSAADIWGFVDLNSNREYTLIGVNTGTAVIDTTNPDVPQLIGFIPGQTTSWRDIKVYQFYDDVLNRWQAYAYVTADGASDGLFVIDLTGLPHSIQKIAYASDFTRAHNVFVANSDYSTGLSLTGDVPQLIIAGSNLAASNNNDGQFRIYSLGNPRSPGFVSTAAAAGDMHDTTTFFVTDQRKNSQCVHALNADACEVLVDFRGSSVDIWDITIANNPVRLSQSQYPNRAFSHSGWQTEDGLYLFVQDEFDESGFGLNTTLNVLSLANLTSPTHAGTWTGPQLARDHNGFVRGNRYYMTNYTRGLTILDITDPTSPSDVGNFDTYGQDDSIEFEGAWGVYPFFNSGTIAVSDINSGLFLLKELTRSVPQGSLAFSSQSFAADEGLQTSITVQRMAGNTGEVSVDFQIVPATADSSDFQTTTGTLNWADGDNSDKSIVIDLTDDLTVEGMEQIILRLVSPRGGATLGDLNTATLYLSDPGAQSQVRFLDTLVESGETGLSTVFLIVQRVGSALGQVSVDYGISGGDASVDADFNGDTSGTLTWSDGDATPKTLIISITNDTDGEATEFFEMSLSNPQGATAPSNTTARVNISSDEGPAPPPTTQPPRRSSGGGSPSPLLMLMLGLVFLRRLNQTGAV
jgi:choice-of-anchor B domain-containing protein